MQVKVPTRKEKKAGKKTQKQMQKQDSANKVSQNQGFRLEHRQQQEQVNTTRSERDDIYLTMLRHRATPVLLQPLPPLPRPRPEVFSNNK